MRFPFWLNGASTVAAVVLLSSCGPSRPSSAELLNALNGSVSVSAPYTVLSVTPDYFPQSTGILTVKGTATGQTREDLYTSVPLEARLSQLGFDAVAWKSSVDQAQRLRSPYRDEVMQLLPGEQQLPVLIRVQIPAHTPVNFNFEASAQKGDSGWAVSDVVLLAQNPPAGRPLTMFEGALVIDTAAEKTATQEILTKEQKFADTLAQAQKAIAEEDAQTRKVYTAATSVNKTYAGNLTIGSSIIAVAFTITQQQLGESVFMSGQMFDPTNETVRKPFTGRIELDPVKAGGFPIKIRTDYQSGASKVQYDTLFAPLRADDFEFRVTESGGLDGKQGEGNPVSLNSK